MNSTLGAASRGDSGITTDGSAAAGGGGGGGGGGGTDPTSSGSTSPLPMYDRHVPKYSQVVLVTLCVLLGCMIVATVLGNVFVITAILIERSLQGVSNYLVLSLAVTDLLVAVLVMPLSLLNEVRTCACPVQGLSYKTRPQSSLSPRKPVITISCLGENCHNISCLGENCENMSCLGENCQTMSCLDEDMSRLCPVLVRTCPGYVLSW